MKHKLLIKAKAGILNLLRGMDDWVTDRVGPVRVIFVVRNEIGFVNQAPILREMQKYPEILAHTVSDGDSEKLHFSDKELQALYEAHEIAAEQAVFMKWHYLIATDILNLYFRRNAIHITIGHGCGFGNLYREDDWLVHQIIQPNVQFVFGMSPSARTYVEELYPGTFHPSKKLFFVTGFPKMDALANGNYSREKILSAYGLDANRQTILISSHWTDDAMLRKWGADLLKTLLPLSQRFNIILTAHPKLWELPESENFSPARLWQELQAIEAANKNLSVHKGGNPLPLMAAADLLICGNSSIRIEYALFDRPALFYKAPGLRFASPHVQSLYENASYVFSELDGLPELVAKALQNADAKAAGNLELKRYFHANLGRSAAVITEVVRKIGRISSPRSSRWRKAQALSLEMQKDKC